MGEWGLDPGFAHESLLRAYTCAQNRTFSKIGPQGKTVSVIIISPLPGIRISLHTINSTISRGFIFAYAKFRENKILAKWRNHSVV